MISLPRLTLRLRMLLSIVAIVALFTLANIAYQVSSENRNQGLDNLQNAVARQLATVTIRQKLEDQQKEILVLDALRESGEDRLSGREIKDARRDVTTLAAEIDELKQFLNPETSDSHLLLSNSFTNLSNLWQDFYSAFNNGKMPATLQIELEYTTAMRLLNEFEASAIQAAEQQALEQQKAVKFTDRITLSIYFFTVALTIGLGYQLIQYTNRSLKDLNFGTIRVGSGDLDYHIPVNSDDEIGDLTIAFNEMSDKLRNAMAQVQQSKERADQANRAKTNFLANMSHELRTPLNAIIGYSEMIIEDYRDHKKLDEEQASEDLQRILSAGRHLLQLINDVLDLAKIESGNMTVFNETFDSIAIIEDLLTTMGPIARKGNNALVMEKADDVPDIYNDSVKFRQLFLNLLSNACKFTENGKISILVTYNDHSRKVIYHVTDTGIGMTPEQLGRVFEAFVQADSSTTKKYGGTGLGLSICKQFVELMDGTMDVTSAEGQGTTFTIVLPTKLPVATRHEVIPAENQQEFALKEEGDNEGQSPGIARVLVIDDDPEARLLLGRHLDKEGYETLQASSAKEGIEIAKNEIPDLILLDLMMPDIDGWTALSVLKETEATRHIPVVLQSMLDEKNLGLDLGAADYLPKPVDRQRMATVLRQLNPNDRRGTALLIAPETDTRELLLNELADEAWQCMVASSQAQAVERINQKQPDIILLGLGMELEAVLEILEAIARQEQLKWKGAAPPVYVVSETPLGNTESRRLDLAADQLLVFNQADTKSINRALAKSLARPDITG